MAKIILADRNKASVTELADCLKKLRPDWHTVALDSGMDALTRVKTQDFDCVIAKMQLADMPGADLLHHRLIDRSLPDEALVNAIDSALRLQHMLSDSDLKRLLKNIQSLPAVPTVYHELVEELSAPNSSLQRVGTIIEADTALTATVLKMVNNAFYGLSQRVESVAQAVALLGAHMIKNATLTAKVFMHFEASDVEMTNLRQINDRANRTGALCNHFARLAHSPKAVIDHAQMAGMMCDIGKLVQMLPDTQDNTFKSDLLGARLLSNWLMPDPVVEAIAMQNEPLDRTANGVTPTQILQAICYLEKCLPDATDDTARQACLDVLAQNLDKVLVERWIDTYTDLQLLTSHNNVNDGDASMVA